MTSWQSTTAAGLYLVTWSLLDLVGFVFEVSPGVSPWYPPHGWSLAFLLICGIRYWPLLIIGPLINGSLIWLKGEWLALILLSLCITSGYSLAAGWLQRWQFQTRFDTLRDTLLFLGVGIVSSFFVAFTSITAFAVTGVVPWDQFAVSLINFWAGDTLGVIGLGPIFLLAMRPVAEWLQVNSRPTQASSETASPRPSWPVHIIQITVTLAAIAMSPFTWNAFSYPPLYFLFGPLMWIAITRGVEGAIWCITGSNIGLALLIGFTPAEVSVADLQLFMVAFSASGLVLGSAMPVIRQSALLQESNTLLNRRNDELHQLTYSLSHDLQSPLRGIRNLAQWIAEDAGELLPEPTQQDLQLLQQRASHMQGMIDEIRNYARITREQTAPEWVQTGTLVKETIDLLDIPNGFTVEVDANMPHLMAPKAPLALVVRNLIGNAVEHHDRPEGSIIINGQDIGMWVRLTVSDDGPGIPLEHHESIFKMFHTLNADEEAQGQGMGLAMVNKIVEVYEGSIQVASGPGRGTTFQLMWPKVTSHA